MKTITFTVAVLLTWIFIVRVAAGDSMTDEQIKVITKLANDTKRAVMEKDHETLVGMLYPPVVKSMGGKEKYVQMLKDEDAKNIAAGVAIESFEFKSSNTLHSGADFKLTFMTSILVANTGGTNRMESKSFQIAFSRLGSNQWYLIDGTRLTIEQFRKVFRGLPEDLKLPMVEKRAL